MLRQQIAAGAFGGPDDGSSFADIVGGDGGPGQGGAPAGSGPVGGTPVADDGFTLGLVADEAGHAICAVGERRPAE